MEPGATDGPAGSQRQLLATDNVRHSCDVTRLILADERPGPRGLAVTALSSRDATVGGCGCSIGAAAGGGVGWAAGDGAGASIWPRGGGSRGDDGRVARSTATTRATTPMPAIAIHRVGD